MNWIQQAQIDVQLQTDIDILKQTVGYLGKKYLSLQEQITLHCDWNSTTFCITD